METRKIAGACFIGGALCALVALIFSPNFWWLGALAGLAGGYLGYEFRLTLTAIPIAVRQMRWKGFTNGKKVVKFLGEYISVKHPFVYLAAVLAVPITAWLLFRTDRSDDWIATVIIILTTPLAFVDVVAILAGIFGFLAILGSRKEMVFWTSGGFGLLEVRDWKEWAQLQIRDGYTEKPLTYLNAYRWMGIGVGVILTAVFWTWWVSILREFAKFGWYLIRLIHSQERYLCAIDGSIGGLIGYWLLVRSEMFLPERVVLVLFGGLLGAVVGIVNWEVVSKRLLKVAAK